VAYLKILDFHLEEKDQDSYIPCNKSLCLSKGKETDTPPTSQNKKDTTKTEEKENGNMKELKEREEENNFPENYGKRFKMTKGGDFHVSGLVATKDQCSGCCVSVQLENIFLHLAAILQEHNVKMSDLAFVCMYVSDMSNFATANSVYKKNFGVNPPSRICVEINLPEPYLVMIECLGSTKKKRSCLHVQSISCWAPACIGPYSQATTLDHIVHLAGQIGLDPATMELVGRGKSGELEDNSAIEETHTVLQNISQVLDVVNSSPSAILFATCFLTDLSHKQQIADLFHHWCEGKGKDHNTVGIKFLEVRHLPKGGEVEIQVISYTRDISKSISNNLHSQSFYHNSPFSGSLIYLPGSFFLIYASADVTKAKELLEFFATNLNKYNMKWGDVTHVRCYYSPLSFNPSTLTAGIEEVCEEVPPITFIPVQKVEENEDTILLECSIWS